MLRPSTILGVERVWIQEALLPVLSPRKTPSCTSFSNIDVIVSGWTNALEPIARNADVHVYLSRILKHGVSSLSEECGDLFAMSTAVKGFRFDTPWQVRSVVRLHLMCVHRVYVLRFVEGCSCLSVSER